MFFWKLLDNNVKNTESPKWLKDKLISIGQKPISAIVDITNYVMFDLNDHCMRMMQTKLIKE